MTNPPPTQSPQYPATPRGLPQLSTNQSTALLRSAVAVSRELLGASFPRVLELVGDSVAGRWDFDVGSPLVQRLLATKSNQLTAALLLRLAAAQDAALERLLAPRPAAGAPQELDAAQLQLVEDAEDAVEMLATRCARRLHGPLEELLRDLDLVVGFLARRDALPPPDNPFGPQVYVLALLQAAGDVALHPEAWSFFLNAFEAELAGEIGRIAQSVLDHLRTRGVEARAIRRARSARKSPPTLAPQRGLAPAPAPAPRPAGAPAAGGPTAAAVAAAPVVHGAGSRFALDTGAAGGAAAAAPAAAAGAEVSPRGDARLILNELLSRLQANVAGGVLPPLTAGQGPVAPTLMDALGELQALGLEGIHGALFAGTPAGSINAWREHLVTQSTRTVDKLTIEIVGMMFDHVLRDAQVPSEIKALLSRLQFPVLKAALLDAAFFASSAHPARRLIDRIAAAAVGWEPYGDENERFRAEVDRLVREIMGHFDRDIGLFERVLNEFEAFLGDISPRASDPIARAKRALEEAEKREVLTINTTIQVRRAFELVELEPYLREFLLGPWVQVLVQASLRDDQTKGYSKSFREVIHEIVWSVQPKGTADERRRLVELIPVLTRVVRDGLALIRQPQREQEEFLQHLMASHAFAVKPDRPGHATSAARCRRRRCAPGWTACS